MRELILGADGGGTKTNLLAVDAHTGEPVARSTAGSIHTVFMGLQTAARHMEEAVRGLNLSDGDRILALGIGDPALDDSGEGDGAPLREEILARGLCPQDALCVSKSDVFMALYAFSGGAPAALIVAGTGSMGVALKRRYRHGTRGELAVVGGWGLPTTDAGSGYDIAVKGVCAALDAFDGVAPPTALCEAALAQFGAASPRALIDRFNGGDMNRSQLAQFAVCVDRCAQAGDAAAREILTGAGTALGRYGLALLRQIEGSPRRLGMYGSVLLHNARVRTALAETVRAEIPDAEIGVPQHPPEYGAARFAADALNLHWEES